MRRIAGNLSAGTANALKGAEHREYSPATVECAWRDGCPCDACKTGRECVEDMRAMGLPATENDIRKIRIPPMVRTSNELWERLAAINLNRHLAK